MVRMVGSTGPKPVSLRCAAPPQAEGGNYGQGRGGRPWRRLRLIVLRRDQYQCQPCKRQGRLSVAEEVDHIICQAEGGTDHLENLQAICKECHAIKTAAETQRGIDRMHGKDAMPLEAHMQPHTPREATAGGPIPAGRGGEDKDSGDTDRIPPIRRNCEKLSPPENQGKAPKAANGHGGKRAGAGRPPADPAYRPDEQFQTDDPEAFLRAVMADPKSPMKDRMTAALALKKTGKAGAPKGKKEQQAEDAHEVVRGKLTPMPSPRPKLQAVK